MLGEDVTQIFVAPHQPVQAIRMEHLKLPRMLRIVFGRLWSLWLEPGQVYVEVSFGYGGLVASCRGGCYDLLRSTGSSRMLVLCDYLDCVRPNLFPKQRCRRRISCRLETHHVAWCVLDIPLALCGCD